MGLASWGGDQPQGEPGAGWPNAKLETLTGLLGEAAGGTPGTVLLGAEAGGGKSRLAAEFTARAGDRALVLAGVASYRPQQRSAPPVPRPLRRWL
jgi:hypothetical protein